MEFGELWAELLPVGRDERTGGYRRYSWTEPDAVCRAWFARNATELGLRTDCDRNGNLWAWWGRPGEGAGRGLIDRGSGSAERFVGRGGGRSAATTKGRASQARRGNGRH